MGSSGFLWVFEAERASLERGEGWLCYARQGNQSNAEIKDEGERRGEEREARPLGSNIRM